MRTPIYWPTELAKLWDDVLECRACVTPAITVIDWSTYVPLKTIGLLPPGARTATYLFVCAEPWGQVKDRAKALARQRSPTGERNFNGTHEDFMLQLAVERWFLNSGEGYYVTDVAKCRMPVAETRVTGRHRYTTCAPHFERELSILRPRAIVAVGRPAFRAARESRKPHWPPILEISHYGKAGIANRKRYLDDGWECSVPGLTAMDDFIRSRLPLSANPAGLSDVTESRRWLLAMYRTQLGAIRRLIDSGALLSPDGHAGKIPGSRGMRLIPSGPL